MHPPPCARCRMERGTAASLGPYEMVRLLHMFTNRAEKSSPHIGNCLHPLSDSRNNKTGRRFGTSWKCSVVSHVTVGARTQGRSSGRLDALDRCIATRSRVAPCDISSRKSEVGRDVN